jgi:hypothetical protein
MYAASVVTPVTSEETVVMDLMRSASLGNEYSLWEEREAGFTVVVLLRTQHITQEDCRKYRMAIF